MKKLVYILFVFFIAYNFINAQEGKGIFEKRMFHDKKALKKLELLEKSKLIELLDLDEETSIKFFARRNEHLKKMRDIFDEREKLIKDLKNSIENNKGSDSYYKEQLSKLLSFDDKMNNERENYYNSLSAILTPKQIAKLAVFEFMFRRELTHTIIKRIPKE